MTEKEQVGAEVDFSFTSSTFGYIFTAGG